MTVVRSPESVQAKFDKHRSEDKENFTGILICLHLDLMRYFYFKHSSFLFMYLFICISSKKSLFSFSGWRVSAVSPMLFLTWTHPSMCSPTTLGSCLETGERTLDCVILTVSSCSGKWLRMVTSPRCPPTTWATSCWLTWWCQPWPRQQQIPSPGRPEWSMSPPAHTTLVSYTWSANTVQYPGFWPIRDKKCTLSDAQTRSLWFTKLNINCVGNMG